MSSHDMKATGERLEKLDCNGVTIKNWAKIYDKSSVWCMLCNKTLAVDHSGIVQVNQHVGSGSHSLKSKTHFSSDQPKFEKIGNNVKFCSKTLQTRYMEAECLWTFKVAKQDWSFCSCDDMNSLFYHMKCEVSEKFSVGHTKMSYIVRHGLSEVLLNELVDDIKASIGTFTLLLDETTTSQVKKQCDFLICYWSESEDSVSTRYIIQLFFVHTSANDLQEMVNNALESSNISAQKMASLSTDGPNTNKAL